MKDKILSTDTWWYSRLLSKVLPSGAVYTLAGFCRNKGAERVSGWGGRGARARERATDDDSACTRRKPIKQAALTFLVFWTGALASALGSASGLASALASAATDDQSWQLVQAQAELQTGPRVQLVQFSPPQQLTSSHNTREDLVLSSQLVFSSLFPEP